ncbi:dockerin type 1 [Diplodia corticola]|uniref:Dockerin type 1 n=1 Tax=Diplodia corticola TaxID=236234 RepID=A0A1J9QP98_9PEZI|nr:dockerin type 1 [Diplodia corticola]OJD30280.1 dockerin type 1 [Diplodia corticola]
MPSNGHFSGLKTTISVLGDDPPRTHRINANSFQQNALLTVNRWQYAAFYQSKDGAGDSNACYPTLARRFLRSSPGEDDGQWEYLVFDDYEQTTDDGHNTISIGICTGDGTIHVSYDHHCDPLRYRYSIQGLATHPTSHAWTAALFTTTSNTLPGLPHASYMDEVSYPRFVSVNDDLLLTYRIGQAGCGSDTLHRYSSSTHQYLPPPPPPPSSPSSSPSSSSPSPPILLAGGAASSPYINGLDHDPRRNLLHVSWTYRAFVAYAGARDPRSAAHKRQAGPNGPENNYDLCYAWSADGGRVWRGGRSGGEGVKVADFGGKGEAIAPPGVGEGTHTRAFGIERGSGVLNQEGQCVEIGGGFFVLNRERWAEGVERVERWVVYWRGVEGSWNRSPIDGYSPTETGSRGSVCADRDSNVYAILPGNTDSSLSIVKASVAEEGHLRFETVWRQDGFDGEPLVDQPKMDERGIISIFTRTDRGADGKRKVVVIDVELG